MPFDPRHPHKTYVHPFHPPIIEQEGHFFWADGCFIPLERVKEILDYDPDFCRRYKVKFNKWKNRWMESRKYPTIIKTSKEG